MTAENTYYYAVVKHKCSESTTSRNFKSQIHKKAEKRKKIIYNIQK